MTPILSALYIAPLIRIFELRAQSLNLSTSILSFVDNGLLISQGKTYNKTLPEFYNSYRVVTDLMVYFGLVMEHDKSKIFHFSRAHNDLNPKLDLSAIGAPTLLFFFDHQFITWCSFAVCGRLSTTSSLQFLRPQRTETPFIGKETQLESIEIKEKSK